MTSPQHKHRPGHTGASDLHEDCAAPESRTASTSCHTESSQHSSRQAPPEATKVQGEVSSSAEPVNSAFKSLLLPTVEQEFRGQVSAPHDMV